jgi:TPR repeat protein
MDSAAFSHDGSRVVTASDDKTARIWDARAASLDSQIVWAEAAQFDPLSSDDRFQLGLPAATNTHQWQLDSSKCDELAAAPYDPSRRGPGVMLDQIDTKTALAACAANQSRSEHQTRLVYQHGRALMAAGNFLAARQDFSEALAAGYASAGIDLAMLLSQSKAGMLDIQRAVFLYEQAWKSGLPIAAFELGWLYEYGVQNSTVAAAAVQQPDLSKAWYWYTKGVGAGEPNALARFAERDEAIAITENDPQRENADLFDAFRYYAAASERAHEEDWPDEAWKIWRYRRATLARVLAHEGMMQQVAAAYTAVRERQMARPPTRWEQIKSMLRL